MAMPGDIDARLYYRVALQRFDDGRLLFEKLQRAHAAIYLSGYAVECILKALLLTTTPTRERAAVLATFRGAIAHNIHWLREKLTQRGVKFPVAEARHLTYVSSWSTDLRYKPGPGDAEDAEAFLAATHAVLAWAKGRM
jgi:hypothetical protein